MSERQPVAQAARTDERRVRILGVDPGFAETGTAVLEQVEGQPVRTCAITMIRTAKDVKRRGTNAVRVSYDDSRRVREFYNALVQVVRTWKPQVLCVETFAPFAGKGGGNAWKTAIVYGVVQAVAISESLLLMTSMPLDIKRAFSLARGATKDAIGDALMARVPDLKAHLDQVPKTRREHLTDAAAHAYLGFAQVAEIRQYTGASL